MINPYYKASAAVRGGAYFANTHAVLKLGMKNLQVLRKSH